MIRTVLRGIGQTLITLGVVVLLFAAYEMWFTDVLNAREQKHITSQLERTWAKGVDPASPAPDPGATPGGTSSPSTPTGKSTGPGESAGKSTGPAQGAGTSAGAGGDDPAVQTGTPAASSVKGGTPLAIIRIPRLGTDYERTIVEGTDTDDLAKGPGHYTGTAMPGQVGNFSIAGHRVTEGHPFTDLDEVRPGDMIVIETARYWYSYRILGDKSTGTFDDPVVGVKGKEIVDPSDGGAVAPVPDHPGSRPSRVMITLTTCNPKYSARQRLVVHALLDGKPLLKTAGRPAALDGGT
jgi:sortase (surface protein transpeptidase)